MKRFDRVWSERGRDGKTQRQKRMELKIYFISAAFLKRVLDVRGLALWKRG